MVESRFYRHYKNKPYKYLGLVRHSETLEDLVLYETRYENANGRIWVRPKDMFFEKIEKNNQLIYRFEPVSFQFEEIEVVTEQQKQIIQDLLIKILGNLDLTKFHRKLNQLQTFYCLIAYDLAEPVAIKIGYAASEEIFYSWYGGVLPQYRELGLGSILMQKQHEWCRQKKFRKIQTKSRNSNIQMIHLNLKSGLQIVGTEREDGDNNKNDIKILFEKIIT